MWQRIRDVTLFGFGLAVGTNEIFVAQTPRQAALLFSAALLGLPLALWQDERRKNGK